MLLRRGWYLGLILALAGCGATVSGGARPITNPLQDRTALEARPPATPPADAVIASPAPAVTGVSADAEGASVRAVAYLAEVLGVSPRELRVEASAGVEVQRVVVRDAFGSVHTVDISAAGVSWVGETRERGVLVAFDEGQRLVVIQSQGRALTLRLARAGTGPALGLRPGAAVAFAYDASARGDGVGVLASIEPLP